MLTSQTDRTRHNIGNDFADGVIYGAYESYKTVEYGDHF